MLILVRAFVDQILDDLYSLCSHRLRARKLSQELLQAHSFPAPVTMLSPEETAEKIYSILEGCLSENADIRRQAEKSLRTCEEQPDFFASLAMIAAADADISDSSVRWLAAVCGKNAVPRSWRHGNFARRSTAISDEEREFVRNTLLSILGTNESRLSIQVSVWISRISRIDYPNSWPMLLNSLLERLTTNDPQRVCHAVTTLDMVLKELASRRLLTDKRSYRAIADNHFHDILTLFQTHMAHLQSSSSAIDPQSSASFIVVERCLKAMRRLVVDGMTTIATNDSVKQLFTKLSDNPQLFFAGSHVQADAPKRLSVLAAKLVLCTYRQHPADFYQYLPHFLNLYCTQLLHMSSDSSSEQLGYLVSRFLREVIQSAEPRIDSDSHSLSNPVQTSNHHLNSLLRQTVQHFLNEETVRQLVNVFLTKIFVWSPSELTAWQDDPETLLKTQNSAEWGECSMRHECEEMFRALLNTNKEFVSSLLFEHAKSLQLNEALLLDACYRAIGICIYDWGSHVDFENWFESQLAPILAAPSSEEIGANVLKARAAWLIGQFVGQLSREGRVKAFQLLVPMLTFSQQDVVVALSAARALQVHVEDLGFYGTDFVPFLNQCLCRVFEMCMQCEDIDTKRNLLGFASGLIERCPLDALSSMIDTIAIALRSMWEQSRGMDQQQSGINNDSWDVTNRDGSQNLYRSSLVILMTCALRKLGPLALSNPTLRQLSLGVIQFGLDLQNSNAGGTYMMEEACELWEAVLSCSVSYDDQLANLFINVNTVLSDNYDNLKIIYRIIEGYALLGQSSFMLTYGSMTLEVLRQALQKLRDRGCLATCEVIEVILQLFPNDGPVLFVPLLQDLLQYVASGVSDVLKAAYLGLLLRGILSNPTCVEQAVIADNNNLCLLMDYALEKLETMYLLQRRKLAVLTLCGIVARHVGNVSDVQERVPRVLEAVVEVLTEMNRNGEHCPSEMTNGDFENYVSRTGEDERLESCLSADMPGSMRRRKLVDLDPASSADLREVASTTLTCIRAAGAELYDQIIAATDVDVLAQLQGLIKA